MEAKVFTENIRDRNEAVQSMHFFLKQAGNKKSSPYPMENLKGLFSRYIGQNIMEEGIPFLSFSKAKYNQVLQKTFEQFNNDNPDTKAYLQGKVDSMVDEYLAKNIGTEQNAIKTLGQLTGEIVQRRSGLHNQLFSIFFARLLNDNIRQIVWKAALADEDEELMFNSGKDAGVNPKRVLDILQFLSDTKAAKFPEIKGTAPELDRMLASVAGRYEQVARKPLIPERLYLLLPLSYIFSTHNDPEKDMGLYWAMYVKLMQIHTTFNGKNATPQNALLYETQLEEHIITLIETLQPINRKLSNKLSELFSLNKTSFLEDTVENIKLAHAKRQFGQIIRDFMESLGAAYANLGLVCMIWDCIFLKHMAQKKSIEVELYLVLGVMLLTMSEDVMECTAPGQFVTIFTENVSEIQVYDFYLLYVGVHKRQTLPQLNQDKEEYKKFPTAKKQTIVLPKKSIEPAKLDLGFLSKDNKGLTGINEDEKEADVSLHSPITDKQVTKIVKPLETEKGTLAAPDIDEYDILAELDL